MSVCVWGGGVSVGVRECVCVCVCGGGGSGNVRKGLESESLETTVCVWQGRINTTEHSTTKHSILGGM